MKSKAHTHCNHAMPLSSMARFREHMKQQLHAQRTSLNMLTAPQLHANVRSPSPATGIHSSPVLNFPDEPALSSPHSTPSLQTESQKDSRVCTLVTSQTTPPHGMHGLLLG